MNNDKLQAFRDAIKKAVEAKKDTSVAKKPNPEALEKFRARIQEMMRNSSEANNK